MKEFRRASNGETWTKVAAEAAEVYPKVIGKLNPDQIATLGGIAQKIIEQSHAAEGEGSPPGVMIAAPAFELRLLMYFASASICQEMASREKVHNDLAARAASQ